MYFVCSDLLPPSWRPKQDMVWDRGIQYFIFAAFMCLATFAVIRVGVTTDPFTSNIIKGVTPLDGGVTNCYWVRTLTMTPSRIFSWVFKKKFFFTYFWLAPNRGKPSLQDKHECALAAVRNIPVQGVHLFLSSPLEPTDMYKRLPLLFLDKWHLSSWV